MSEAASNKMSLLISSDEWHQFERWMLSCLLADERDPRGHFYLECNGLERNWVTTDGTQWTIFSCQGEPPSGVADPDASISLLVNPRIFRNLRPKDALLIVEEHEDRSFQTLRCDGIDFTVEALQGQFPDWRDVVESAEGNKVSVDVNELTSACRAICVPPQGVDLSDGAPVHAWLYATEGYLYLRAPWIEYPDSYVRMKPESEVDNSVPVLVPPVQLHRLLSGVTDEKIDLFLPLDPLSPVGLASSDYTALLFPVDRWGRERERLEQLLCSYLSLKAVVRDNDGDYPIRTEDEVDYWVRLNTDVTPLTVQVFSVLARNCECSEELLRELNDINASASHIKVVWFQGTVMAEIDLVAHELDMSELANAMETVTETTRKYLPVLGSFFSLPNTE